MICPRCHYDRDRLDATSRRDSRTKICTTCAIDESMVDFAVAEAFKDGIITKVEVKSVLHNEKRWLTGLPEAPIVI